MNSNMAKECRTGAWLFRINPSNDRQLQRATVGGGFSLLWTAPNGERIIDIYTFDDNVLIDTDRHDYIRYKSGVLSLR